MSNITESIYNNLSYWKGQFVGCLISDNSYVQNKQIQTIEKVAAAGMAITGLVAAKAFLSLSFTLATGGLPITSALVLFTMTNSCIVFKNLFGLAKTHFDYIYLNPFKINNSAGLKEALKPNTFYFEKAIHFSVDAINPFIDKIAEMTL